MADRFARIFEFLGYQPRIRKDAVEALAGVESRVGTKLPTLLREWYSYEELGRRYVEVTRDDLLFSILELGADGDGAELTRVALRQRMLPVATGYGGYGSDEIWAVCLDGSADPPVFTDGQSQCKLWRRYAESFSEFLFLRAWDHSRIISRASVDLYLLAETASVSPHSLTILKERLNSLPTTPNWDSGTTYRFQAGNRFLRIETERSEAVWELTADSAAELACLARQVWTLDGVGPSLKGEGNQSGNILDAIRLDPPRE